MIILLSIHYVLSVIVLMDDQKEKRLESLGVTWRSDKNPETASDRFDRNFDLLVAFQEREGHVRVPT